MRQNQPVDDALTILFRPAQVDFLKARAAQDGVHVATLLREILENFMEGEANEGNAGMAQDSEEAAR